MSSSSRTQNPQHAKKAWSKSLRNPLTVAGAVIAVVLGPSAVTASALQQANAAPLHHSAPDKDPSNRPYRAVPYTPQYATLPRPARTQGTVL
ncbi:hypothetical protein [Streptomyces sp. NPDC002845]